MGEMKGKLPDPLRRREILYGRDTPREVLIEHGDLYAAEGRWNDAVEFYGRAEHQEGLLRIKGIALKEGDYFLFSQVMEFLGNPEDEGWREVGRAAEEKGKLQFALKAYERCRDTEGVARVKEKIRKIEEER